MDWLAGRCIFLSMTKKSGSLRWAEHALLAVSCKGELLLVGIYTHPFHPKTGWIPQ
jgi:hypothetical protein